MDDPIPPVTDDETVLRHVPPGSTWVAPGPRLSSMNFNPRPERGETGISVSRLRFTTPAALVARVGDPAGGSLVAEATVADIRRLGFDVVPVPLDDDPGHAEIRPVEPLANRGVRKDLAAVFRFLAPAPPEPGS